MTLGVAVAVVAVAVVVPMFDHLNPIAKLLGLFGSSREAAEVAGPIEILDVRQVGQLQVASGAASVHVVYCNAHVSATSDLGPDQFTECDGWRDGKAVALVVARSSAYIDMTNLDPRRIQADPAARSVRLRLPLPTVARPTTSGEDTTVIAYEPSHLPFVGNDVEADWLSTAQTAAIPEAQRALDGSLIEPGTASAKEVFTAMFTSLGYTQIDITFDPAPEAVGPPSLS